MQLRISADTDTLNRGTTQFIMLLANEARINFELFTIQLTVSSKGVFTRATATGYACNCAQTTTRTPDLHAAPLECSSLCALSGHGCRQGRCATSRSGRRVPARRIPGPNRAPGQRRGNMDAR